ncbi:transcriptional regulator ATRX isoform X2 [Halyomorpha halys]|uniref:transcriptional regulator ATRX isoform X2 n=1 Tax=Halyomorpha halys TaxID=286706 RepID=UPI0006D4C7E3|nr:transcriptional regulator ATRX-like isoform X2 [Halyomorpha halys]
MFKKSSKLPTIVEEEEIECELTTTIPVTESRLTNKEIQGEGDILNKKISCTSCGRSIIRIITKGEAIIHPLMNTLVCKKCLSFYEDGEFSIDEDGTDKYCRWCGQGGKLYMCTKCPYGFCRRCIGRNVDRSVLKKIKDDKCWKCFTCNPVPIYRLQAQCSAAQKYAHQLKKKKEEQLNVKKSSIHKKSNEKTTVITEESLPSKKVQNKLKGASSKSEDQVKADEESAGAVKLENLRTDLNHLTISVKEIANMANEVHNKCIKCKENLYKSDILDNLEDVIHLNSKVDQFCTNINSNVRLVKKGFEEYVENWFQLVNEGVKLKGDTEKIFRSGSSEMEENYCQSVEDHDRGVQGYLRSSLSFTTRNQSDQFLLPNADINSDINSENASNPFEGSDDFEDDWVAPPEIYPDFKMGFLPPVPHREEAGSEKNDWPNQSEPKSSKIDNPYDFLDKSQLRSLPSINEEDTEEEDEWINLADIADQL